jgi:hypothetical protein
VYGKYNEGETTAGDVNGVGGNLFGVKLSYVLNDDPVGFPASGIRGVYSFTPPDIYSNYGYLNTVGVAGGYWSSSAYDGTLAYSPLFNSISNPASYNYRVDSQNVRCVRSY